MRDTLIVIRIGKDGRLKDSLPCTFCYNLIQATGIKNIYYSTNDDNITYVKTNLVQVDKIRLSRANFLVHSKVQSAKCKKLI